MSNYFSTFDNPYAVMAQGAYPEAPIRLPFDNLRDDQKQRLSSDKPKSVPFDFSQSVKVGKKTYPGGQNLPNNGVVYLQPDPTLRSVTQTIDLPLPPLTFSYPPPTVTTNVSYQKGLLTDEPAGFNAYFLTDTPTLSSQTKNA